MHVTLLPFSDVQVAIDKAREEWRETTDFNTAHHSEEEIDAVIPTGKDSFPFRHVMPSFFHTRSGHWVPLIAASQGVSCWHVFEIPRYLAQELVGLYAVWCSGRGIDRDTLKEPKSMFPKTTTAGLSTEKVFHGGKWFLRVDYCSAKDSDVGHSIVETMPLAACTPR